jgi:hypothetical protein
MSITLTALQKQRRDTAANWTTANPTLLAGEIGIESDTGYWKVGDGTTAWTSLVYLSGLGAEIPVSRLADGAARQLLQTDAAGTGVEWTSNIDVPGTLDVTGASTFDAGVTIQGDLTVNGTTTTIDTQNLIVEDKNIEIGKVATPTDVTADGGGITLKGSTDKTINWVDATDAWTFSEHVNIASAKEYRIAGTKVLDATSLGSGVISSSLTSVGTIGTGTWQGTAINKTYLDATLVSTGDTGTVTSTMIADGTIVNADINASAAIAGTKISPDFGSQTVTTTGVISAALGTAGAPTITFTGDTNTGIYSPGADQVAISTGGTGRLFIDASGRISIGTSTSNVPLTVQADSGQASLRVIGRQVDNLSFIGFTNFGQTVDYGTISSGPTYLALGTGSSEHVRVDSSGRVGIGTTSVSNKFVVSNGGAEGFEIDPGQSSNKNIVLHYNRSTPAYVVAESRAAQHIFSIGGSEVSRYDASGRLLVGTSSARSNFYNDTNSAFIQLESASNDGSALALVQNFNANTLGSQLILAKSNAASVGSNTLVASGDACGRVSFQGNDGSQFVEAAQIRCDIDGTPGANDMPGRLVFSVTSDGSASPTEAVRINSNRQLLVGASSIGAAGAGVIYNTGRIASEGVYNTTTGSAANVTIGADYFMARSTSSGKYKTDIETLQDSYADAILGCRPVWFRSLCAIDNPDWGYWGFIAEEVAAIDPRLVQWKTIEVTYDEDGAVVQAPCEPEAEGVQYDRFVPHLLNLIKRQGEAIAELQAKVAALEAS